MNSLGKDGHSSRAKKAGKIGRDTLPSEENPAQIPSNQPKDDAALGTDPLPFRILRSAIRAVPAVKFALGIAGIIAVIPIVKLFGISLLTATLGAVVMLVLMTGLVIFANVASLKANSLRAPILFLVWCSIILVIAVAVALFTSVFWGYPLSLKSVVLFNTTSVGDRSPMIAILPFECRVQVQSANVTDNCEVLRATIRTGLTGLPRVRVLSSTATDTNVWAEGKRRAQDLLQLRSQYGVSVVLDATVIGAGSQLLFTPELNDLGRSSSTKWTNTYNFESSKIPVIAADIVRQVYRSLVGDLTFAEEHTLNERLPTRLDSLSKYLAGMTYQQGLDHSTIRTNEELRKSIDFFQQAIESEPTFALPYAAKASTFVLLFEYGGAQLSEAVREATGAIELALLYGSSLAETHAARGIMYDTFDWNWENAEKEYKEAIRLNPTYATAHHWYSTCLAIEGRLTEALSESERARELAPDSPIVQAVKGWILIFMGRYDEATTTLEAVRTRNPNFGPALWRLGLAYQLKGMSANALQVLSQWEHDPFQMAARGYVYARIGDHTQALAVIEQLQVQPYYSSYLIAGIYANLQRPDEAFTFLQRACQARDDLLAYLNIDPLMAPIRSDSRFSDLAGNITGCAVAHGPRTGESADLQNQLHPSCAIPST